jgi:VRR-NUC domain
MTARRRRHRPEDALQRAIVEHYHQRAAPGVFMFAVPNGGFRRPVEAAILKATGTVAGIPDTIWIKNGQVFALELKAEGGRLSPAQEEVLIKLRECGAIATHAHGLDQALQILERWQLLRGRASS